jgi:osmotically-inducible protein OsmY
MPRDTRPAYRVSGTRETIETATKSIKDASIIAAVAAKLAADPGLSPLRSNVDTAGGRVALISDAPDSKTRDRATTLARSAEGAVEADNRPKRQKKG